MRYYKFLDLDWTSAATEMKKYVLVNPSLCNAGYQGAWRNCNRNDVVNKVPQLQQMFDPLGLTIKRVSLFVMYYTIGQIHIDDDAEHPFRINFPILNCKDTETKFYKVLNLPTTANQPNNVV